MSAAPSATASGNLIFSLYIINKAGGLIYQKDFVTLPKLQGNDYLRLLSTFHSLHAIAARGIHIQQPNTHAHANSGASDRDPSFPNLAAMTRGITAIDTRDFRLHCYPTITGLKFVLSAAPTQLNAEKLLSHIYGLYSDYVLKNAFYELEMPIRCEQFDAKVIAFIQSIQQAALLQQQQQQQAIR